MQKFSPQALQRLSQEMAEFARKAVSTREESTCVGEAVFRIELAAEVLWPGSRVGLFGSRACGLDIPDSDVDLIVFGAYTG